MKSLVNKAKLSALKNIQSQISLPNVPTVNIPTTFMSQSATPQPIISQPLIPQPEMLQSEIPQSIISQPGLIQPEIPVSNILQPINQNQIAKLNQLEQPTIHLVTPQPVYKLENIYNKIKDIGRLIQIIRIEGHGIIRGSELWGLLSKILGEDEINGDLVAELKNYEFNTSILNSIEKRILSINEPKPDAYPDYYMNNIVKLYNQSNPGDINVISLMHMGFDIGQLEYIIYKYMSKPTLPCYIPKLYDDNLFIKILSMIQNLGRVFKNVYRNELPEDKKMFPLLLIKYIQELFEKNGSEIMNQMSKYKINRDKIKLFFEVTMDEDLHNADDFNINEEDTLSERVYKVTYKYLRDDFGSQINDYILSISYKIVFTMLDLYDYDKPHLPMDKLIELMFYSGTFLASMEIGQESKPTTFLSNMQGFDDISINKLFNLQSYFENNNQVPNKELMELLDKIYKKINTKKFSISSTKIDLIPDHIKYLPIEVTQLYCLSKPKSMKHFLLLQIRRLKSLMFFIMYWKKT